MAFWKPEIKCDPQYEALMRASVAKHKTIPHCDSYILHAPGVCTFCDKRPELQAWREENKVNFTGHYDKDKEICWSEQRRNLPIIEQWGGNVPEPYGTDRKIIQ